MATRETNQAGSVTFDKRTRTWYLRWRDADGRRRAFRIGTQEQYSAREQASLCRAAVRCEWMQLAY